MLSPAELTDLSRQLVPVLDTMQLRVVAADRGTATTEMPAGPNVNHAGFMYAGSLFALGEVLGGVIPLTTWDTPGFVPLVKDAHIRFLRPARGTIRATATLPEDEITRVLGETSTSDRADFTLEASLADEAGTEVAALLSHYQLRRLG